MQNTKSGKLSLATVVVVMISAMILTSCNTPTEPVSTENSAEGSSAFSSSSSDMTPVPTLSAPDSSEPISSEHDLSSDPDIQSSSESSSFSLPVSSNSSSGRASSAPTSSTPDPTPTDEPPLIDNRNFDFNGPIPKDVLNNYLSRAVTHNGLAAFAGYGNVPAGGNPDFEDDFRMLINIGAMFIGRAAHVWGYADDTFHYNEAARIADIVHDHDPRIILQACVFEAVYKDNVNAISIPSWVFQAFDMPVENRKFRYSDMLFTQGLYVDQWGTNGSIPDLTRLETQMWFYYRCAKYIDAGYEAIHLGQLSPMTRLDPGKLQLAALLSKVRAYAAEHARRKWVILDAHIYSAGEATYIKSGKVHLLLDFHSFPLRPKDNFTGSKTASDGFQPAILEKNFGDAIYGRSAGGIHPAGWETDYNPFLCEFDNSGYDKLNRDKNLGGMWPWGYDEITWFSKQPPKRRDEILIDFYAWINTNYTYGNIQMPTRVPLAFPFTVYYESEEYGSTPFNNIHFFKANTQSPNSLTSFSLEKTIKNIWRIAN